MFPLGYRFPNDAGPNGQVGSICPMFDNTV